MVALLQTTRFIYFALLTFKALACPKPTLGDTLTLCTSSWALKILTVHVVLISNQTAYISTTSQPYFDIHIVQHVAFLKEIVCMYMTHHIKDLAFFGHVAPFHEARVCITIQVD